MSLFTCSALTSRRFPPLNHRLILLRALHNTRHNGGDVSHRTSSCLADIPMHSTHGEGLELSHSSDSEFRNGCRPGALNRMPYGCSGHQNTKRRSPLLKVGRPFSAFIILSIHRSRNSGSAQGLLLCHIVTFIRCLCSKVLDITLSHCMHTVSPISVT